MRLVAKDLPLTSHRQARRAAEAARCAAVEGRYWPYRDRLFAEQGRFTEAQLIGYAVDLGLERATFAACVTERRFAKDVEADLAQARALGLGSTPSFLINGRTLVGAHPTDAFRSIIEEVLNGQRGGPRVPRGSSERRGISGTASAAPVR